MRKPCQMWMDIFALLIEVKKAYTNTNIEQSYTAVGILMTKYATHC